MRKHAQYKQIFTKTLPKLHCTVNWTSEYSTKFQKQAICKTNLQKTSPNSKQPANLQVLKKQIQNLTKTQASDNDW